jgi:hypothetical protein
MRRWRSSRLAQQIVTPGALVTSRAAEDRQDARTQRGTLTPARPQLIGAFSPPLAFPQCRALLEPVINLDQPVRELGQELVELSLLVCRVVFHFPPPVSYV